MEYMIPIAAVLGVIVVLGLWFLGKGSGAKAGETVTLWRHRDFDPPPKPFHARTPDSVEHSLDRLAGSWQYYVLTTWINDDPYAESDTSVVSEWFDVQRTDHRKWEIRLAMRNGSKIEGEPWQPAPAAFLGEWESVYSQLPESHEALL